MSAPSPKILVIRGGALGDFILTLPAIALIRKNFPQAQIEILGYPHITAIAHLRYYADHLKDIEYASLAGFFNPKGTLDPEWANYFSRFHQIISYLYDPDGFFEYNLRRCGVKNLLMGEPRILTDDHASLQLAKPLEALALFCETPPVAKVFPNASDRQQASIHLPFDDIPTLAIHPGSGSASKNWPSAYWVEFLSNLHARHPAQRLVIVGGESDTSVLQILRDRFDNKPQFQFLENFPLPILAAIFQKCSLFIGHDSGISHLAAASGCRCVLLFGPTNPNVWAPLGNHVHIVTSPQKTMEAIRVSDLEKNISL